MLKKILIVLAVLVLIVALFPLFLSKDFVVTRSTTINAPLATVYPMVADLGRWSAWDPWSPTDPDATITVSDPSTGSGAVRSWDGEILGAGSMTVKSVKENEQVDFVLAFTKPFAMESDVTFTFQAAGEGTEVIWTNSGTMEGYISGLFVLMMDSMVGPDFENGLAKMKEEAEGA